MVPVDVQPDRGAQRDEPQQRQGGDEHAQADDERDAEGHPPVGAPCGIGVLGGDHDSTFRTASFGAGPRLDVRGRLTAERPSALTLAPGALTRRGPFYLTPRMMNVGYGSGGTRHSPVSSTGLPGRRCVPATPLITHPRLISYWGCTTLSSADRCRPVPVSRTERRCRRTAPAKKRQTDHDGCIRSRSPESFGRPSRSDRPTAGRVNGAVAGLFVLAAGRIRAAPT